MSCRETDPLLSTSYSRTSKFTESKASPTDCKTILASQRWIFNLQKFQDRLRYHTGITVPYEEIIRRAKNLENIHFYSDITDENFAPIAKALSTSNIKHISFVHCHNFRGSHLSLLKKVQTLCFYFCDTLETLDLHECNDLTSLDMASCPNTDKVILKREIRFFALDCNSLRETMAGNNRITYQTAEVKKL